MNEITIYGARWCKNTQAIIQYLRDQNIPYTLLEIDDDEKGKEYSRVVMEINQGKRITPTLVINGENYANPSQKELASVLENREPDNEITRCSNGKILSNGDTVLLTRDLDVKGSSINLKQGTSLEKIKLTGDPAYIDCKIGKSTLAIKTEFIKKKG